MSNNITLSVTVLSYNNAQYIEDCLTSIERQGIDSYEVFIVDDCSTDDSCEVIKRFIENRPQFTLIEKEENSGGAISSQLGVARSTGKYCAIVDSDDIVADGAYRRLIRRIEEDDSDFASGMPVNYLSGYLFSFLSNKNENSVFARSHIISNAVEKAAYSFHACYWDCVFRTEFLKRNDIHMASGLLYADRPFIFDAIYKADKISIDQGFVYYWRHKNNPNKQSITDLKNEYQGIADRCNSFDAQLKVSLDNSKKAGHLNMGIWENSLERLVYPLHELLKSDDVDKNFIRKVCERYRIFLVEYAGFFEQLIDGGHISTINAFILLCLLENDIDSIFKLATVEDVRPSLTDAVKKTDITRRQVFIKDCGSITAKRIVREGKALFVYIEIPNSLRRVIEVDKVIAITRYYKMYSFELDIDSNNRFDISGLPESTYNFIISYKIGDEYMLQELNKGTIGAIPLHYEENNLLVTTSNKGGNPFTIMQKNKYTFLKRDNSYMLYVNQNDGEIEKLFFYNVINNKKIDLEEIEKNLFKFDIDILPEGSNMLFAKHRNKICSMISRHQISNSVYQMEEYKRLFMSNRIEVVK